MSVDWGKHFDALISDVGWKAVSGSVREKVYALVEEWIFGDRDALKGAVKAALKDKALGDEEMVGILAILALDWAGKKSELGETFLTDLVRSLTDGELTATEIAELAANWVATHVTTNETLRDLIKAAVNGNLSRLEVLDALFEWLEDRSGVAGLKRRVEKILKSAKPVNLRSLVLVTVSYLIKEGVLKKASITQEGLVEDLVKAIGKLDEDSPLVAVFEALAQEDYAGAAQQILGDLGIEDSGALVQGLVRIFLEEKPSAVIQDFLAGAIKRQLKGDVTGKQAAELAQTIVGIANGTIKLIPELEERQLFKAEFGIDEEKWPVWVETRNILYAAKLALAGGSVVSTDPMARPHVFAAATITPGTVLADLAEPADHQKLMRLVFTFTKGVYGRLPRGEKYLTHGPISMDNVNARDAAEVMFNDIWMNVFS